MKLVLFLVCSILTLCYLFSAWFAITQLSGFGRWWLFIPSIIAAFFYGCWAWKFRLWHKTYSI